MRVRIEAPSSPYPADKLAAGVARLRAAGVEVDEAGAVLRGRHAYLNGDDDARRRSLQDALASDADVILLARGGYGLTRVLGALEVPSRVRSPTIMGFSDATALFAHLQRRGVPCVHGPLATTIAAEPDVTFRHALAVLERKARGTAIAVRGAQATIAAEGTLFAANLCVLCALLGTPSFPKLDGCVLVLEEVGERPYRIDRLLTQLLDAGALRGVRAVIAGHLTQCTEPAPPRADGATAAGARDAAPDALEIFRERLTALPLAWGIEVGHEPPNFALPLGARVRLTADAAGGALTLLEDLP